MENNETGATTPETNGTQTGINYEQEFKKLQVELEKQKRLKDDYAKESAGYKKQLADKMTDDERNAQAQKEFEARMTQLEAENKAFKLEKELLTEGFTSQECDKLIKGGFNGKDIMEIIRLRLEENSKSIKAGLLKATTPTDPMGNGTTNASKGKSEFAKFQEENENKVNSGKVEL